MRKIIFITGSTDGIGKLAAQRFAKDGHTVIIHGRNPNKVDALVKEMQKAHGKDQIRGFVADLTDLDAVRTLGETMVKELSHLDVVINNAGVFKSPQIITEAGLEMRMVVNFLAPVLLTETILPLLKKGTLPRLINLSSAAQAKVNPALLLRKSQVSAQEAYAQSKLAITMWSMQMAKQNPDLTVIPVNPGSLLNTRMVREGYGTFWSPADKGSDILFDLAINAVHADRSGNYFDNDQGSYGRAHGDAYRPEQISQLMKVADSILAEYR